MPLGIPHSQFLTWSAADRGYALAWRRDKAETCSGCGTRPDEWGTDPDAYISDHFTCQGCARLTEERENNLDQVGDRPAPGQHVFLQPRERYEALHPTS